MAGFQGRDERECRSPLVLVAEWFQEANRLAENGDGLGRLSTLEGRDVLGVTPPAISVPVSR